MGTSLTARCPLGLMQNVEVACPEQKRYKGRVQSVGVPQFLSQNETAIHSVHSMNEGEKNVLSANYGGVATQDINSVTEITA